MSDFDPTTNRIPFGLLSEDEQTALIHWPHGWQYYDPDFEYWAESKGDIWCSSFVYRGKAAPVVVSRYRNIEPQHGEYTSRHFADLVASPERIAVLRIDTCNGVSTAHLETVGGDQ